MNTELDPDITALFENQSAPPDDELFVKKVSRRITRARHMRSLAETAMQRISVVVFMIVIPVIINILRILAARLEPALSNVTAFNPVPVAWALPGILSLTFMILYVFRLNGIAETE
jgi:hypothetical protein